MPNEARRKAQAWDTATLDPKTIGDQNDVGVWTEEGEGGGAGDECRRLRKAILPSDRPVKMISQPQD